MSLIRVSNDKEVRAEARVLAQLGFEFVRFRNGGRSHPVFAHPAYGEIGMASTPGDRNWLKPHRRQLAKRMGVTVHELNARITGQQPGKHAASHRRPPNGHGRNRPRGGRHLSVAAESIAAPAPLALVRPAPVAYGPCDPITETRRDQWAALQAENVRANLSNPWPWRSAA